MTDEYSTLYDQHISSSYGVDFDTATVANNLDVFNGTPETEVPGDNFENPYAIGSFICGCLFLPVAVLGIIGNGFTIYLFSRPQMSSSINFLFCGLAVIDTTLLIIGTPIFASLSIYAYTKDDYLLCVIYILSVTAYPIAMMAQTGSVWTMIVITLERYLAICWPFRARSVCNMRHARMSFLFVVLCAIFYNVIRYWEYSFDPNTYVLEEFLKGNHLYMTIYHHWMYFVLIFLVPFLVLAVFNGLVVRTIQQARRHRLTLSRQQSREHKTAFMMIVVVVVFFCCNVLAFIVNAIERLKPAGPCHSVVSTVNATDVNMECIDDQPIFFPFLEDVNNLLVELNSSVNFLIYYSFSYRFRSLFKNMWKSLKLKRSQSPLDSVEDVSHTSYVPLNGLENNCLKLTTNPVDETSS